MISALGFVLMVCIVAILSVYRANKYWMAALVGALILSLEFIALGFGVSLTGPWYTILTTIAFLDMLIFGAKGFTKVTKISKKMGIVIGVLLILGVVAVYLLIAGSLATGALRGG